MRVDLDELEQYRANAEYNADYLLLLEAVAPALIAELRAARECAAMLMQAYKVGAIAHWFDEDGDGGKFVLEKYAKATKGDG